MIEIGKLKANPGEKVQGYYQVQGTDFSFPVTVVCGKKAGKTILITCGVHGSEYVGIQSGIELATEILPEEICGNLILVHPLNKQGFYSRTRCDVPEDGKNLNRVFPGKKEGTISEQVAYAFTQDFFPLADFYLDLHGGDMFEKVVPYSYFSGIVEPKIVEESRRVAGLIDAEYMVKSNSSGGAYHCAADQGIPSLLIEIGGQGQWSREEVHYYKENVYNLLHYFGTLPGEVKLPEKEPVEIAFAEHLHANMTGCWYPSVEIGETVEKGKKLGEVRDYFGAKLQEMYAPYHATILYMTTTLAIEEGKSLIAIGKLSS